MGVHLTNNTGGVAFASCTLVGGTASGSHDYSTYQRVGGAGLGMQGTRAALYDCTLTGGRGGDGFDGAGPGGPAARVIAGAGSTGLFTSGSSFTGGRGGDDWEDIFQF